MIFLYTGNPGSGKSLHAVNDILRNLRHGKPVLANFRINGEYAKHPEMFQWTDNTQLKPSLLEDFAMYYWQDKKRIKEDEILLVIDECQLIFNARTWAKNSPWLSFFSQHRKMGYCPILICQSDMMIDKQIRAVVEYEYKHRKMANAGGFGKVISFLAGSPFLYKKEWYAVRSMGKGTAIGWQTGQYGKAVYKAYDTFKTW